mmetsp:Transcript_76497/g.234109  ORF Transcript_76497/g.234109 Transcript_76497/m.234109 type:complete len:183 (+) Transcript_76497:251-799(+)
MTAAPSGPGPSPEWAHDLWPSIDDGKAPPSRSAAAAGLVSLPSSSPSSMPAAPDKHEQSRQQRLSGTGPHSMSNVGKNISEYSRERPDTRTITQPNLKKKLKVQHNRNTAHPTDVVAELTKLRPMVRMAYLVRRRRSRAKSLTASLRIIDAVPEVESHLLVLPDSSGVCVYAYEKWRLKEKT